MRTKIDLNESEIDLNESEIDLNECEHFLEANMVLYIDNNTYAFLYLL